jgi:hypothetical protein
MDTSGGGKNRNAGVRTTTTAKDSVHMLARAVAKTRTGQLQVRHLKANCKRQASSIPNVKLLNGSNMPIIGLGYVDAALTELVDAQIQ